MNQATNIDFATLNDPALAHLLHEASCRVAANGSDDVAVETAVFAENEVCHRLQIDPNETERGLTPRAAALVDAFVNEHRVRRGSR